MTASRKAIIWLLALGVITIPSEGAAASAEQVTISVSGDLLVHDSLYEYALKFGGDNYDFTKSLAPVKPLLNADINICHLETPLSAGEPRTYPMFATPDTLAAAIKATGWDGCSAASNHSLDQGSVGVFHTIRKFKDAGLVISGIRNRAVNRLRNDPAVGWYEVKGIRVAHLSYSWSTNGIMPAFEWLVNSPISTNAIIRSAKAVKRNGADLVIVSIHAGTEYAATPNSFQRSVAAALTKNPAVDAVVGHHAHVVQYAQMLNGKPVIYGLGNFWSGQGAWSEQHSSQYGALVKLRFSRNVAQFGEPISEFSYTGANVTPVFTTPEGWQVQPAGRIPITSRWGLSARTATTEVMNRLAPIISP